jgi:hypothetical protein
MIREDGVKIKEEEEKMEAMEDENEVEMGGPCGPGAGHNGSAGLAAEAAQPLLSNCRVDPTQGAEFQILLVP